MIVVVFGLCTVELGILRLLFLSPTNSKQYFHFFCIDCYCCAIHAGCWFWPSVGKLRGCCCFLGPDRGALLMYAVPLYQTSETSFRGAVGKETYV